MRAMARNVTVRRDAHRDGSDNQAGHAEVSQEQQKSRSATRDERA
jgi:hypothetical protein